MGCIARLRPGHIIRLRIHMLMLITPIHILDMDMVDIMHIILLLPSPQSARAGMVESGLTKRIMVGGTAIAGVVWVLGEVESTVNRLRLSLRGGSRRLLVGRGRLGSGRRTLTMYVPLSGTWKGES